MTCETFRRMMLHNPHGFTAAERGAFMGHKRRYQAYETLLRKISTAALSSLPPEKVEDLRRQAEALCAKDQMDPEVGL